MFNSLIAKRFKKIFKESGIFIKIFDTPFTEKIKGFKGNLKGMKYGEFIKILQGKKFLENKLF
ncbi:MAG: hypothetical protein CM15mP124_1740 [Alphaproteobacteria bacterium]|nr:MAG: hypothetical protein CM15mP124_1740 [Alphaproteobacteria bacterium]